MREIETVFVVLPVWRRSLDADLQSVSKGMTQFKAVMFIEGNALHG